MKVEGYALAAAEVRRYAASLSKDLVNCDYHQSVPGEENIFEEHDRFFSRSFPVKSSKFSRCSDFK